MFLLSKAKEHALQVMPLQLLVQFKDTMQSLHIVNMNILINK